jgi:hypothetical protein
VIPPNVRPFFQYLITAVSLTGLGIFLVKVLTTAPPAGMIPPSMEGPAPGAREPAKVG